PLVTVPEPGQLLLLGSGIGMLIVLARRRARW
ncbi:MAG: PEP-CTERM sorting domain-containing protein, partial [Deltaproteobacteria bacterium]|nr:PEP-CTERM sorting domain-containing protein [Deltaproteobacteria bacterium]